MMPDGEGVEAWLKAQGILGDPLEPEAYAELSQQWLEAYCANVKAKTGEWVHRGFRWHAYSHGFETALEGEEALLAYLKQDQSRYLIHFEHDRLIFDCRGPRCPVLPNIGDDVYLFPYDLAWTMIFTHEDCLGQGPFFALKSGAR